MSHSPAPFLKHILSEAELLSEESAGVEYSSFFADRILKHAFVRSLEIVGEATKRLPKAFCETHPEVPWSQMARMRDRLVHGYDVINYEVVWHVVTVEVPRLIPQLRELIKHSEG